MPGLLYDRHGDPKILEFQPHRLALCVTIFYPAASWSRPELGPVTEGEAEE